MVGCIGLACINAYSYTYTRIVLYDSAIEPIRTAGKVKPPYSLVAVEDSMTTHRHNIGYISELFHAFRCIPKFTALTQLTSSNNGLRDPLQLIFLGLLS